MRTFPRHPARRRGRQVARPGPRLPPAYVPRICSSNALSSRSGLVASGSRGRELMVPVEVDPTVCQLPTATAELHYQ
jgi:hypothetical protein